MTDWCPDWRDALWGRHPQHAEAVAAASDFIAQTSSPPEREAEKQCLTEDEGGDDV